MKNFSSAGYRTTRLVNLDARKQVLALYEQSIRLSRQALDDLSERNGKEAVNQLRNCDVCLYELQSALNFSAGGELALNLWNLYEYVRENVELASEKLDHVPLENGLFVLEALRDGWLQVLGRQQRRGSSVVRTYREPAQLCRVC